MCLLGTFAQHTVVNEASCIKIDKDVPLDRACLLGCGVVTGWGSSVYAAEVAPGDTVVVVGIGGGQPNRVDAARIAIGRAADRARGSVAASDAFFPFRDTLDELAAAGVTAVIQPGGSVRDEESVAAANEHGIAMVLTGTRHFRH